MGRLARWLVVAGVIGSGACVPPSVYTVSIASSPGHVTYAQRNPDKLQSDYLVDCEVRTSTPSPFAERPNSATQITTGCQVVVLAGAE